MKTILILLPIVGTIIYLLFFKKSGKKQEIIQSPTLTPEKEEILEIDTPVKSDPEPIKWQIPSDEQGEMPIKPLPVNCQKASFNAAPEKYFYSDCCGEFFEGEGFQPWEKRSPVSIDSNKPFEGMTLLDVEAEIEC